MLTGDERARIREARSASVRAALDATKAVERVYVPKPKRRRVSVDPSTKGARQYRSRLKRFGRDGMAKKDRDYYANRQRLKGYVLTDDKITCPHCGYTGPYRSPYRHYDDCPSSLNGRRAKR